jgi:hypothetical protein
MVTRRARPGGSIARTALFGALALAVVFGALAVETADATGYIANAPHAVVVPREARPNIVAAGSTKSRGSAWFASLFLVASFAALAAYLFSSGRKVGHRHTLANFSIRLRAPPTLHVAL